MRHFYTYLLLVLLLPLGGWAQNIQSVKGTVQDEEGRPLPGITVLIRGTGTGGATNEQGAFELKAEAAAFVPTTLPPTTLVPLPSYSSRPTTPLAPTWATTR